MTAERARRIEHAHAILRAAIAAADPGSVVAAALRPGGHVEGTRRVHVIAIGKAAPAMCHAALATLPRRPDACLIVAPGSRAQHAAGDCRLLAGAHPVPDASSVRAAEAVARVLRGAAAGDVVLLLLSGGASAACALPVSGLRIETYARVVHALLRAGADIAELNCVRRHLDALKGGGMAALADPARLLALVVSDVPHDDIAVIASGPVSPSPTTPDDARRVLRTHGLLDEELERALSAWEPAPSAVFERVAARIILDNADARRGAAERARQLGYRVVEENTPVTGEAREQGAGIARRIAGVDAIAEMPTCIVAGGETTVTVQGAGHGGRNQELVLAAALALPADSRAVIGSVGTDGVDGPTDAAGAVADAGSVTRAAAAGIDARALLQQNDSYAFFRRAGGHVITGPTGTNVMDVIVGLAGPSR